MMETLHLLPAELKEHIFSYMKKCDMLNVACCNKEWHEIMKYFLYSDVKIECDKMEQLRSLEDLKLTRRLCIYSNHSRQSWSDLKVNYLKIINYCDPEKLIALHLSKCDIANEEMELTFASFYNLQEVDLELCSRIGSSSWVKLCDLSSVKMLSLRGAGKSITDKDLRKIIGSLKLEMLNLNSCENITYASLELITNEIQLRQLNIAFNESRFINGFQHIGRLINLDVLNIQETKINDDILINICHNLRKLKCLIVRTCKLTDKGLCYIYKLELLLKLDLSNNFAVEYGNTITDKGLYHLRNSTSLTKLEIHLHDLITDCGIIYLVSLKMLTYLDVSLTEITDLSMSYISQLTLLQELYLEGCYKITDEGIREIAQLTLLQKLYLQNCFKITDEGLRHISLLRFLHQLGLEDCVQITDQGIRQLSSLPALRNLNISGCELVTEEGLQCLVSAIETTNH